MLLWIVCRLVCSPVFFSACTNCVLFLLISQSKGEHHITLYSTLSSRACARTRAHTHAHTRTHSRTHTHTHTLDNGICLTTNAFICGTWQYALFILRCHNHNRVILRVLQIASSCTSKPYKYCLVVSDGVPYPVDVGVDTGEGSRNVAWCVGACERRYSDLHPTVFTFTNQRTTAVALDIVTKNARVSTSANENADRKSRTREKHTAKCHLVFGLGLGLELGLVSRLGSGLVRYYC